MVFKTGMVAAVEDFLICPDKRIFDISIYFKSFKICQPPIINRKGDVRSPIIKLSDIEKSSSIRKSPDFQKASANTSDTVQSKVVNDQHDDQTENIAVNEIDRTIQSPYEKGTTSQMDSFDISKDSKRKLTFSPEKDDDNASINLSHPLPSIDRLKSQRKSPRIEKIHTPPQTLNEKVHTPPQTLRSNTKICNNQTYSVSPKRKRNDNETTIQKVSPKQARISAEEIRGTRISAEEIRGTKRSVGVGAPCRHKKKRRKRICMLTPSEKRRRKLAKEEKQSEKGEDNESCSTPKVAKYPTSSKNNSKNKEKKSSEDNVELKKKVDNQVANEVARPSRNDGQMKPSRSDDQIKPSRNDGQMKPSRNDGHMKPSRNDDQVKSSHNDDQMRQSCSDDQMKSCRNNDQMRLSRNGDQMKPTRNGDQVGQSRNDDTLVNNSIGNDMDGRLVDYSNDDDILEDDEIDISGENRVEVELLDDDVNDFMDNENLPLSTLAELGMFKYYDSTTNTYLYNALFKEANTSSYTHIEDCDGLSIRPLIDDVNFSVCLLKLKAGAEKPLRQNNTYDLCFLVFIGIFEVQLLDQLAYVHAGATFRIPICNAYSIRNISKKPAVLMQISSKK